MQNLKSARFTIGQHTVHGVPHVYNWSLTVGRQVGHKHLVSIPVR